MPIRKGVDIFMTTGISTACLYPLLLEDSLKIIAGMNVEAAEIFVNCDSELSTEMLKELRKIADGSGVKILSLHPWTAPIEPIMFFSDYERRFLEGVERYRRYYEAANILGAELVIFHGGARHANLSYELYFDRFGRLVDDAVKNGSRLCQENVARCTSYSADFFRAMVKGVPDAEFVLDIKQAVRAGQDPFELAGVMEGKIRHLHFSDNDAANDCLAPGRGAFNTEEFLLAIAKTGFDKGVIVELYRENFGEIVELSEGYQRLLTEVSTAVKSAELFDKIRQNT